MYPKKQPQKIEFLKRTNEILQNYQGKYKVTLLINCSVGLLILPKEKWDKYLPKNDVNRKDWGIAPEDMSICKADYSKESEFDATESDYSVKNIARHLRNSIAHYRFIFSSQSEKIEKITFDDKKGDKTNFKLEMSVKDFRKFLMKLTETMLNKIDNQRIKIN